MPVNQLVRAAARLAVETLESRRLMSQSGIFLDPAIEIPGPSGGALALRPRGVGVGASPQASGGPEAPPVTSTIEGITFEQEGNLNGSPGFGSIPPDAHGAAGPAHVVHVVNSAITFHTKAGALTFQSDLFTFFEGAASTDLFDPRVVYDHFSNRWVVVALDKTDTVEGFLTNTSRMFIAASDDADPNGAWTVRSINTDISIGGQASWADFPGLALDDEAIFVSASQFRFGSNAFASNRLQIIDKAQLYAGTLSFTTHDVLGTLGLANVAGGFALQPTMMYGTQPVGLGTYLVNSAGWQDGGTGVDFVLVIQVNNPLTAPAFTGTFVGQGGNVDNPAVALPGAPQSGSAVTIRTNDRRVPSNGVWRNNNLYFAHTTLPLSGADAGQATAKWYRVTADGTNAPATADSGVVGGENLGAATHTFFPAVAVDALGNMAIGFSASGSTFFPSAGYTVRLSTDVAGTTQPAGLYANGLAFYSRTYFSPPNQSNLNRWGDYSSVAVDPANDSFWAFNQYARTQGSAFNGESGRWGTRFANFSATSATAPAAPSTPDLNAASDSGLSSIDNITNDNTPTFSGTAEANSTVRLFAGLTEVGSTTASAGGAWQITASTLLSGTYNFTATAANAGGQGLASAPLSVTIDTVAPQVITKVFNFLTSQSVVFGFDSNVGASLSNVDFTITNLTTANTIAAAALSVSYAAGTNQATVTFPGVGILPDGNYTASVSSAGTTDVAGNAAVVGAPLAFFVLAGDATRDRSVNLDDFTALAANFGQSPRNFAQGEFTYNGTVDLDDFTILAANFGKTLPPPADLPRANGSAAAHSSPFGEALIEDRVIDAVLG